MTALLNVRDLQVRFSAPGGRVFHALNGVTLQLREGEVLGILGESGSGKSTLAKTLLQLLPGNAQVANGSIEFEGRSLLSLSAPEMNEIRGAKLAMIWQEPGQALNPVLRVGDQIAEVLRAHRDWDRQRRREEVESLLDRVNLGSPGRRIYDAYPHQLSGGQQQRVVIAQAMACNPALVIADEPTASLDSATESGILKLFREFKLERRMSLLLITHDPAILPGLADRVAVLYAGRVVEEAPSEQLFQQPRHPYVKALLACLPPASGRFTRGDRLPKIEGTPPDAEQPKDGCSFSPRCQQRLEKCQSLPPPVTDMLDESRVECFLYEH